MSEAIFFKESTDDVNSFLDPTEEIFTGLEEVLDELIQTMAWGFLERCWLGKAEDPHCERPPPPASPRLSSLPVGGWGAAHLSLVLSNPHAGTFVVFTSCGDICQEHT